MAEIEKCDICGEEIDEEMYDLFEDDDLCYCNMLANIKHEIAQAKIDRTREIIILLSAYEIYDGAKELVTTTYGTKLKRGENAKKRIM